MNVQTDEHLDKLANYFIFHKLRDRYGWTFEEFLDKYLNGRYEA